MKRLSLGMLNRSEGKAMQLADAVGSPRRRIVRGSVGYSIPRTTYSDSRKSAYVHSGTKRAFDLTVAIGLLVVMLPVLVLIAALVKSTSKGPVIFRQQRNGLGGCFSIYKFRTMYHEDAGNQGAFVKQASRGDPRVTRLGYWLRKLSLDELPQVFNVLRGEMSIVGPRPHALSHDVHYAKLVSDYMKRYDCRPGITGLAQVSGARGETGTPADMQRRIHYDLQYMEAASFVYDCKLILSTAARLLDTRDVY